MKKQIDSESLARQVLNHVRETSDAPEKFSETTNYGWIIDKVNTVDLEGDVDDVGLTGPSGISPKNEAALRRGEGTKFKMLDDDGVWYYEGRYVGDGSQFEPLDDFGTPDSGCTSIEYFENGTWHQI